MLLLQLIPSDPNLSQAEVHLRFKEVASNVLVFTDCS